MSEGKKWGQVVMDLDLENCSFKQGKYIVTKGKTNQDSRWTLRCQKSPCPGKAIILQAKLEAVIDQTGKEIPLDEFDQETRDLLETTNKQVISCLRHLLLKVAGSADIDYSRPKSENCYRDDDYDEKGLAPVIPINRSRQ